MDWLHLTLAYRIERSDYDLILLSAHAHPVIYFLAIYPKIYCMYVVWHGLFQDIQYPNLVIVGLFAGKMNIVEQIIQNVDLLIPRYITWFRFHYNFNPYFCLKNSCVTVSVTLDIFSRHI